MKKRFTIYLLATALIVFFGCAQQQTSDSKDKKKVLATVKGRVTTPLEKALIYVYKAGMDLKGPPLQTIEASELEGEFSLQLPAGDYFFVARKRVNDEAIGPVIPGDYKSEIIGPIKITESKEIVIDLIALRKMGDEKANIASKVVSNTSFAGVITDSSGDPIEGIRVHVYDHIQMSERPKFVSEKTGPDGKYRIFLPEGGTYYICARDRFGGPPKVGDLYGRYDKGTIDPTSIMLKTNEQLTEVDITAHKVW